MASTRHSNPTAPKSPNSDAVPLPPVPAPPPQKHLRKLAALPPRPPTEVVDAEPPNRPTPPSSTSAIPQTCFPSPTSVAHVVAPPPNSSPRSPAAVAAAAMRSCADVALVNSTKHDHIHCTEAASHSISTKHGEINMDKSKSNLHIHSLPENQHEQRYPHAATQQSCPNDPPSSQLPSDTPSTVQSPPSEHNRTPSHPPDPPVDIHDPNYHYRPDLVNSMPSRPLEMVSKASFQSVLTHFIEADPANEQTDAVLTNKIRNLLDHLDALVEQLTLRLTNSLFDALSHPKCLATLIFLLSDISASSTPIMADIRKSYRYPYIVSNILANGSMGIRDAFMSSKYLVNYLLSFLDGFVVLSTGEIDSKPLQPASNNPIIVGNVIQILTSYMETVPDVLLAYFEARSTFVPSLVNLLHIGSMPKLLSSIIPDRCVDDVGRMDPSSVSFDITMTKALNTLASGHVLHHLSNAFVQASQSVFSIMTQHPQETDKLQQAQQLAYNSVEVYGELVKKTIRAVRINNSDPACQYLSIFANVSSAETLAQILLVGIELFRSTNNMETSSLIAALDLTVAVVKLVEEDSEKRVASITGQPPALDVSGLEHTLQPLLRSLMSILLDVVFTGSRHGRVRLRILELFVECQRVFSESTLLVIDKLRFGEVALKLMQLHSRNSLLQYIVCRAVETGLVYNTDSVTSARHWLVRSRLVERTMTGWHNAGGDDNWYKPLIAQTQPNLSTLVHLSCCITHWIAIQRHGLAAGAVDPVEGYLDGDLVAQFEAFFERSIERIMQFESSELCGPKPRRGPARSVGGSLGRSFGNFGDTSAALLRRSTSSGSARGVAKLVRSASAHRFGYVEPSTGTRSRYDELFCDEECVGGGREKKILGGREGGGSEKMSSSRKSSGSFLSIFD